MTRPPPIQRCRGGRNGLVEKTMICFVVFLTFLALGCGAQNSPTTYNSNTRGHHLRGIRRIPSNIYTSKATPIAEDDPISAEQRHQTVRAVLPQYYQEKHVSTPPSFPIAVAPSASAPPDSVRGQFAPLLAKTMEERREHLVQALKHQPSPTQQLNSPTQQLARKPLPQAVRPSPPTQQRSAPTAASMPHVQRQSFGKTGQQHPIQRPTPEQEKQERLKARWRKIGPLIGPTGSRYQRMRLIQQKAWTHPASTTTTQWTTTVLPSTQKSPLVPQTPKHSSTPTQVPSSSAETVRPTVHKTHTVTAAQMAFRSTQPTREPDSFVQTNNIRRQSLRTGSAFAPDSPSTTDSLQNEKFAKPARIFGERTQHFPSASRISFPGRRITGPILTPLPEDPSPSQYPHQVHTKIQLPTPEDTGPLIVEDIAPTELPTVELPTATQDYHHRQNVHVEKRFRLVSNRLIHRPRLKIRTHEEPRAQGKAINTRQGPINLPELAPFQHPQQKPVSESSSNVPSFPSTDTFAPQLPAESGSKRAEGGRPRNLPRVTSWGDEDVEAINGGGNAPPQEEFGAGTGFGGGDLGHGGGSAPSDLPPGFGESFGLNGASMPLDELAPKEEPSTTTTEEPTTTTQKPTTTTPEAPLIIPENSGLRPARPPKEFQGGFGSSRGSPFSSFNPNAAIGSSGGGFGSGPGPAPPPEPPPEPPKGNKGGKKGRGGKKIATTPPPEFKEEDFFTGDSALIPNNRGPTGDGYNPPIFPDQAVPPAVPAVSQGGEAAGIGPPMQRPYQPAAMEVTENTPTTLKPSSLLNILNKADVGFNQMLTNFESGAPLESAMIDILEVALGSQKLDSQAKILSHVDRTIGLDNLQRLQRWANTGGALDELKEQFIKIAKNYKPPPETNAITIPPEFEYLFKTSG